MAPPFPPPPHATITSASKTEMRHGIRRIVRCYSSLDLPPAGGDCL